MVPSSGGPSGFSGPNGPGERPSISLPAPDQAGAALQALADFFEGHQTLTRAEFVEILRKIEPSR